MIINCGNRRLVSYRYGWMIQIQRKNKKTGALEWREDRPAYPASLAQACTMLLERVLADGADIGPSELPDALRTAAHQVRVWFEDARKAA